MRDINETPGAVKAASGALRPQPAAPAGFAGAAASAAAGSAAASVSASAAGAAAGSAAAAGAAAQQGDKANAGTPAVASAARLGLLIGAQRLLVDLSEAGEIAPIPSLIMPVPQTRPWLVGVTNLRGSLYTVCDLGRFCGGQPTDTGKEARLISFSPSLDFNASFIVSRMLGLRNVASMTELEGATSIGADAAGLSSRNTPGDWLGRFYADADGHVWRELSLARLARNSDFLMIAR